MDPEPGGPKTEKHTHQDPDLQYYKEVLATCCSVSEEGKIPAAFVSTLKKLGSGYINGTRVALGNNCVHNSGSVCFYFIFFMFYWPVLNMNRLLHGTTNA
jgi:hypothetical protein